MYNNSAIFKREIDTQMKLAVGEEWDKIIIENIIKTMPERRRQNHERQGFATGY